MSGYFHCMKVCCLEAPVWRGPVTRFAKCMLVISMASVSLGQVSARAVSSGRTLARKYLATAQSTLAAGDAATAKKQLSLAVQADPKLTEAYILLGTIEFQSGHAQDAIRSYKKAVALSPASYPG